MHSKFFRKVGQSMLIYRNLTIFNMRMTTSSIFYFINFAYVIYLLMSRVAIFIISRCQKYHIFESKGQENPGICQRYAHLP